MRGRWGFNWGFKTWRSRRLVRSWRDPLLGLLRCGGQATGEVCYGTHCEQQSRPPKLFREV